MFVTGTSSQFVLSTIFVVLLRGSKFKKSIESILLCNHEAKF